MHWHRDGRLRAILVALAFGAFGCGESRPNLSPTASEAPERHQQAERQAQDVARANAQAERTFLRVPSRPNHGNSAPRRRAAG